MRKLLCKPCLAFDALASLVFCDYCRRDIPIVKEWVEKTYNGIHVGPSDAFFDLLINHHSLDEIESFGVEKLVEIYPQYIDENEYTTKYKVEILNGLQRLSTSNFTDLWENEILPFVRKQCMSFLTLCNDRQITNILADVERVHQKPIVDDIHVYMTYFTYPVSFLLTPNSYLTNNVDKGEFDTYGTLRLFAHELCHRFPNEKSVGAYKKVCESNEYLNKSYWMLSNIVGAGGYEEEFVQAVEHTIAIRNNLETYDDAINHFSSHWYENSVPIAIILFSELVKLDDFPIDMNEWIYIVLSSGIVDSDVENKLNAIIPGYTDQFELNWEKQKVKNPDLFAKYCFNK